MSYYFHWNKFKEKSDGISIEFFPTSSSSAKSVSLFSRKRSNNQQVLTALSMNTTKHHFVERNLTVLPKKLKYFTFDHTMNQTECEEFIE